MATRNRYAEIMSQYQEAQPFSFTGYPSSYTGGYDVTPQAYAAPVSRYANIMGQSNMTGPGGRPVDYNPEWTALSDAGKAAFYAKSPFFSKATQFGQNVFGFNKLGMLQNAMDPGFVSRQKLIAQGIDPAKTAAGAFPGGSGPPPSGGFVSTPDTQAVQNAINKTNFSGMDRGSTSNSTRTPDTQAVQNAINNTDFSGMDRSSYAQGGHVSMQHLLGPDPAGPDDGYAALNDGEFVINDKAVKKYGIELMHAINSGKISKGELLGLLEM